jgi:cysteine desulfurase
MTSESNTCQLPVYLDYNASTPVDPRVLEKMLPAFSQDFGNPSSQSHIFGQKAATLVSDARIKFADFINCAPRELIFTSGATESCNLAIKGAAAIYKDRGNHIITSMVEHKAVLSTCKYLANQGFEVTYLQPDANGQISPDQIQSAMTDKTILVCVMAANNILGTINPVAEIGQLCRKRGVLFFCDATHAAGKIIIDVQQMKFDMAAFSSHKIYGPKGAGALYVRGKSPRVRLESLIHGGAHERLLRAGTENVPGIVGMAAAAEVAAEELQTQSQAVASLRDDFQCGIEQKIADVQIVASNADRLPNTTVIAFAGIKAEPLLRAMPQIAASSGSACDSASGDSNYVFSAIGLDEETSKSCVRFSLGRFTTKEQVDFAIQYIAQKVAELRG